MPVNVRVVDFVIRSEFEIPVSEAADRTGSDGASGDVVSMKMVVVADEGPALPATSTEVTESVWVPGLSRLEVTEYVVAVVVT